MQRGDVELWHSGDAKDACRPPPSGHPEGQKRFSDFAIKKMTKTGRRRWKKASGEDATMSGKLSEPATPVGN